MIDDDWYEPNASIDAGRWRAEGYRQAAEDAATRLNPGRAGGASTVVELQPGNWTRYVLTLGTFDPRDNAQLSLDGRGRAALAVVWLDSGRGHVFTLEAGGVLHEDYVKGKLGGSVSDAWVLGRFLTALREALQSTPAVT